MTQTLPAPAAWPIMGAADEITAARAWRCVWQAPVEGGLPAPAPAETNAPR